MSVNARQARLRRAIREIEDVFVEHLQDIAPETPTSAEISRDMGLPEDLTNRILVDCQRIVDLNEQEHGSRKAWTVE